MIILMIMAGCYGVIQLALLASPARTLRISSLLLAVAAGAYGCAVVALVLEFGYTRMVHAVSGDSLSVVVERAGYTVDPVIEELVKLLPLVVLLMACRRLRRQWSLVDYLLFGAATGAGFALTEALLRFGWRSGRSISDGHGGFVVLTSLNPPHVLGIRAVLASWLPPPVDSLDLFGATSAGVNLHLVWTALAAAGIGVVVRVRGPLRLLGVLPAGWVALDHAVNNLSVASFSSDGFFTVTDAVRRALPVLVLLLLVGLTALDVRTLRLAARSRPELLLAAERTGRRPFVLARAVVIAAPWSSVVVLRFLLARRAVWNSHDDAELAEQVHEVAARLGGQPSRERWQKARREFGPRLRGPRQALRSWAVVVWAVLAVPVLAYAVLGAVPATAALQRWLGTTAVLGVLAVLTIAAIVLLGHQSVRVVRSLRAAARQPWTDKLVRAALRATSGVGALVLGSAAIVRWFGGAAATDSLVQNFHLLDAVAAAAVLLALMLAVLALLMLFPPGGLVLAGAGTVAVDAATAVAVARLAAILGALGIMLAAASGAGGGGGNENGSNGESHSSNSSSEPPEDFTPAQREAYEYATRPDKLNHVFVPKHNLEPLVQRFGGRENVMAQIVRSLGSDVPESGVFEVTRTVGGQNVVIRGAVVRGIVKIGTVFTP